MKNYIGGLFALLTSVTMVSAYADCCPGCGKGKILGSVTSAPAPVVSKTAPTAEAATPVANTPAMTPNDAKTTVVASAENLSEDDSEDDE